MDSRSTRLAVRHKHGGNRGGAAVGSHIVHAVDLHALANGVSGQGKGALKPIRRGAEFGEEVAEDALAGDAEEDGATQRMEGIQPAEEGDVLRLGFAEADSGIDHDR